MSTERAGFVSSVGVGLPPSPVRPALWTSGPKNRPLVRGRGVAPLRRGFRQATPAAPPHQGSLFPSPIEISSFSPAGVSHPSSRPPGDGGRASSEPPAGGVERHDLVRHGHNSSGELGRLTGCPDSVWIRAVCREHLNVRYVRVRCKRRDCDYCGVIGRWQIAERISWGVQHYQDRGDYVAWLVLTFARDVPKATAVRQLAGMVKKIRVRSPGAQYAATYELTERGRLHINLVVAPWVWVDVREVQRWWGARLSLRIVWDATSLGLETAKPFGAVNLGEYLCKLDQGVPLGWGRRVSFSRAWPKHELQLERIPGLVWTHVGPAAADVVRWGWETGRLVAVDVRVFAWSTQVADPLCSCFSSLDRPGGKRHPPLTGSDPAPT